MAVDAIKQSSEQQDPQEGKPAAGDSTADQHTGVFYTTGGEGGKPLEKHELLNEPVPDDCFMEVGSAAVLGSRCL